MKHEIENVVWPVIPVINYRGCELWKVKNGFKMWDKIFLTIEEIDEAIDNAGQSISNSLVVPNNGNIECINSEEK
jgi:hypothetical protein